MDKLSDNYEHEANSAKLIKFMKNMEINQHDIQLNNYQLLGKLWLELNENNRTILDKDYEYKYKKVGETYNLNMNNRMCQHIDYSKITLEEVKELCLNNSKEGYFKCVCKQQLKYVYLIKHIKLQYILKVGICCYKSIRKIKTNETLCFRCNIPLGHRNSIFHCKECLKIDKKEKEEKRIKLLKKKEREEELNRIKEKENMIKERQQMLLNDPYELEKELKRIKKNKIKELNEKIDYYGEMIYTQFGKFKDFKIKNIPLWYAPWIKQKYINEGKTLKYINNVLTYYQLIYDKEHL